MTEAEADIRQAKRVLRIIALVCAWVSLWWMPYGSGAAQFLASGAIVWTAREPQLPRVLEAAWKPRLVGMLALTVASFPLAVIATYFGNLVPAEAAPSLLNALSAVARLAPWNTGYIDMIYGIQGMYGAAGALNYLASVLEFVLFPYLIFFMYPIELVTFVEIFLYGKFAKINLFVVIVIIVICAGYLPLFFHGSEEIYMSCRRYGSKACAGNIYTVLFGHGRMGHFQILVPLIVFWLGAAGLISLHGKIIFALEDRMLIVRSRWRRNDRS